MSESAARKAFREPSLVRIKGSSWAVFAEDEVRLAETEIIGTAFVGFASYMNGDTIRSYTEVGRYTSIGRDVRLGLAVHNHRHISMSPFFDLPTTADEMRLVSKTPLRRTVIGSDCWIGDSSRVMSGVRVGDGAIVGTSAVVTKDVAPYEIVGGVPARHIGWRFDEELRSTLVQVRWWELEPELLQKILVPDTKESIARLVSVTGSAPRKALDYRYIRPTP